MAEVIRGEIVPSPSVERLTEFDAAEVIVVRALITRLMSPRGKEETAERIAREFNIPPATFYRWKRSKHWQEIEAEIAADLLAQVRRELVGLATKAGRVLGELLDNAEAKGSPTRYAAALAVLDRAAHILPAERNREETERILTYIPRPGRGDIPPANGAPGTGDLAHQAERAEETGRPAGSIGSPVDSPEAWQLPAGSRRSVMRGSTE